MYCLSFVSDFPILIFFTIFTELHGLCTFQKSLTQPLLCFMLSSQSSAVTLLCFIQCTDRLERDRLIMFLNKLILHKVGLSSLHFLLVNYWSGERLWKKNCRARKLNTQDAADHSRWRTLIKDVWWLGWVWVGECFFSGTRLPGY